MSAWARAGTQCKLKLSVSAQGEKRNRHNDIQHSDWNDRCWEGSHPPCNYLHIVIPRLFSQNIC